MASKSFYVQVSLRVLGITGLALGIALCLYLLPNYLAIVPCILLIQQTYALTRYVNRSNEKVALFFDSIKNEDFSLKFPEDMPEKSFQDLYKKINEVNEQIHQVFKDNRTQEAYFSEVLKQVDIGIMSYNLKGHILFANEKAKRLLNSKQLNHIRQLESVNTELYKLLSDPIPFNRKLIELTNEREVTQLSLKSSKIELPHESMNLLTFQDIRHELDEREADSWSKLIRVMTHEIMNAVTPITSISAALLDNFKSGDELISKDQIDNNRIENTVKGLGVIKEQGKDLMNFIQSYRSYLSISSPQKELVQIKELLERVKLIFSYDPQNDYAKINITVSPESLGLYIDQKQISQVLVNLCKNALQSIRDAGQENGLIEIFAGINHEGNKYIEIRDNGPGIDEKLIDHIFIPFFTTKKSGTGIGLSLSKQVMRMHGGNLRVHSIPTESTSFFLIFDNLENS